MMESHSLFEKHYFGVIDYVAFGLMLFVSASCGIYYGYIKPRYYKEPEEPSEKKINFGSRKLNEYLLGSRSLTVFPVAMSLVASYISGVTILGTPSEIYVYGTQYWLIIIPIIAMGFTIRYIYLPVFSSLRVGSSYEYLELRFNQTIRSVVSVMFVMDEIFFLPIVIYVPALAFNQVTGVNLYLIGGIVCGVCIFYTYLGGMRAVVSTDAWQIVIMFISVFVIAIIATFQLGGVSEVFHKAQEGGRIIFDNFSPSPYERQSFWAVMIGGYLYWTSFNSVNQTMVQRYMSLPSIKHARTSIMIFTIGVVLSISCCCYTGLLIFAQYAGCDPKSAGLVKANDQLYPLFVMQTVGKYYGIPGLFIAGVFGAALSSLSVVLNSTSAVIYEDLVKGCFKINLTERQSAIFVKMTILVLGAAAMGCLFIVEKLGGVLGVATALTAIASGTTFGIFTLGMLNPWSNEKGALAGALAGAVVSGWVSLGSQVMAADGRVLPRQLPVSVESCGNSTIDHITYPDESGVFPLYRLSYHWINPIGVVLVIVVGSIVSYFTGPRKLVDIDPELISPVLHRFLPQKCFDNYGTANGTHSREQSSSQTLSETSISNNNAETEDDFGNERFGVKNRIINAFGSVKNIGNVTNVAKQYQKPT